MGTSKQCPPSFTASFFSDLHRSVRGTDPHTKNYNASFTPQLQDQYKGAEHTRGLTHGTRRKNRAGGRGGVSTGFVQGTLEVGSLWSCCIPQCTQAKSVYLLTGAL